MSEHQYGTRLNKRSTSTPNAGPSAEDTLAARIEAMRHDLEQAIRKQESEFTSRLAALEVKYESKVKERDQTIAKLEKDLNNMNMLLVQMQGQIETLPKDKDAQDEGAWKTIEPRIKASFKDILEGEAREIATKSVREHVKLQTQRIDEMKAEFTKGVEGGNADAERLLQRTTSYNIRLMDVGAEYRIPSKAKLAQKTQELLNKVNKKATVMDVRYRTSTIQRNGEEVKQTHLIVTLPGPAVVEETINLARKQRKNTAGKKDQKPFPYSDRDLSPAMVKMRQRMQEKLREWRAQMAPKKEGEWVDIGAWIEYRDGRPVLLKRNKTDREGDVRGIVQEWILNPDTTEFEVAPKRAQGDKGGRGSTAPTTQ